ncbi:G-protein coupled receptor Mth2-like [Diorhabda sublineata]|uniref:G-protein coupled receptor Mth2-like n=1 Tax=Diorhabda sublineata TaxID=1163346 RepID=UPI0024E0FEC1|nr:G-protein coupled receptor Mth2-like [Diorhabda sublineata]
MASKEGNYFCTKSATTSSSFRISATHDVSDDSATCIDVVDQSATIFRKNHSEYRKIEQVDLFNKCCPPNYFYDTEKRSCANSSNRTNIFGQNVVKIGLPQCEIISDLTVDLKTDVVWDDFNVVILKTGEMYAKNQFCLDETTIGRGVVRICRNSRFCKTVKCVRKCCPDGKSFVNGSHCEDTFVNGIQFDKFETFLGKTEDDIAIIHGYPVGKVYRELDVSPFYLDEKGNFHDTKTDSIFPLKEQPYCLEHATKNGINFGSVYFGFFISDNPPLATKFLWNRAAMIVSGVFLLLTIIFYVVSNETRKVFGKTLVCFCCSLLFLYTALVYHTFKTNLHYKPTKTLCKFIGFAIIYLGYCSFVWLQVICYDIYCTFGSSNRQLIKIEKQKRNFVKFLYYNIYGWGVPFLYTSFLVFVYETDSLPGPIKIDMAVTKCAIEKGNYAEIVFRAIPLTIIQILNLVFFTKTVMYVLAVKREIKKMVETPSTLKKKKKFFKKKAKFRLVVKLSFSMGVLYLFEVISSFFDFNDYEATAILEIIWDFIDCLQGLFIFIIFVCKKRNYIRLKKSSAVERIRKISSTTSRKTSIINNIANINNP